MDDLLYILLGIIWIAVGFYRYNQKKKAREAAGEIVHKTEHNEAKPAVASDFDDFFEQLEKNDWKDTQKFEKSGFEQNADPVYPNRYDNNGTDLFEEEYNRMGIATIEEENIENSEYFSGKKTENHYEIDLNEEQETDHEELENFDLKKAVIYSEILNRPEF